MTDRVNGYDGTYGIGYRYGWGDYLGDMAKLSTRDLAFCPGAIWNARNYTQAWNTYTYHAAQPYGFYLNYTGRPHYIVADPFEMPYQTALELHGYSNPCVPTAATTAAKIEMLTAQAGLEAKAGQVVYDLKDRAAIAQWKDAECLKDKPELKKEVEELAEKLENMLKKIYEAMENKEKLSMPEVEAKIDALIEASKPLKEQANALKEKLEKVYNEYNKKKAEEAAASVNEGADSGSGSAAGETTVTTTEGDKKMDTDALAAEYDVKKPIIAEDQDVSSAVKNVKLNTNNSDDAKNHKDFMNMFTTGELNSKNIIEVLDGVLSSNYDLYDGIYEMDNSNKAMTEVIKTIRARVKELKDAKYLDQATAKTIQNALNLVESKLGNGEDIPSSSPKFDWGNKKNLDVNGILKEIVAKLKGKGTQADFDAKIKEKQKERTTKAAADFYKDHAVGKAGKEVKGKPALPAGVTYLPNSKEFQWKYDSSTVFKGKSYKALNDNILASKKTEVIAKWNEVLKKMDKHLKDKPTS